MVVGSEWRLIKGLRDAAISGSTLTILTDAVVAQVQEALSPAPTGLGMAFADLAVTGRRAFGDFVSNAPQEGGPIEAAAMAKLSALGTTGVTPALISEATSMVLDRAYQVAWFLRAQTDRGELGWIAVSGEDDLPHRPVNVPRTSFPQHDLYFTVPGDLGEVAVQTRFAIATAEEPPAPPPLPPPGERNLPPVLAQPTLPEGDQIILFINGSDSRLEEANDLIPKLVRLPDGRPSGYSVISFDLPGSGYASLIDHLEVGSWNPKTAADAVGTAGATDSVLSFMEKFIFRFVAALDNTRLGREGPVESRIAAVVGGSLGGNLALRLARRGGWVRNAVAWDAGSVWPSMWHSKSHEDVDAAEMWAGASTVIPEVGSPETDGSRDAFFAGVFDKKIPLKTQPEQWYRDGWPGKLQHITMARLDRRETYTSQFRRWHWRVSIEELMWSWRDPAVQDFKSRILLGAGTEDNFWPARFFKHTERLAHDLGNIDGDTFFFDHTGHSVHAERPEALAGKIMAFLGKPASTAWTNFQVFLMPTRDPPGGLLDCLFAYKADDGTAAFHEIRSDLQNTSPVWEGTWSTDWTNLQIFPWGGKNFLFLYKAGDRTVAFDEIPSDLQDTNRLWEATWVKDWTHFQIFPWGGTNFLFAYAAGDRTVAFDEIDSDLQGTTNLWEATWLKDWTHFQIFPWGGKNFLFAYAAGDRTVAFDEIDSDLQGTTNLWEATWLKDWTHFQIFPWGGKYYLFAYASGDGTVAFDQIPSDLQGTTPISRGTLTTG
jgi:pimeloyl-ACP methyl ester carboxylesterase